MIDGVRVTMLKQILDDRGKVMHMLRKDSTSFHGFGEVYFSCVYPGDIKAWHQHKEMVINYAVPLGNIKFVLYDDRVDSPTRGLIQEIFMGPDNYCRVTVPPLIWNGFKGIGSEMALVTNFASIMHDPSEMERLKPFDSKIPYDWNVKHK
jgi:dTDP-4-dehydrorhamnose 3,5-epimerase